DPMKFRHFAACAVAVIALAGCKKNNTEGAEGTPANDKIIVTQASPPPGGTWADVVNMSAADGFVMGNPNAKVKLIEIGSLFCPFCKRFEDEGSPILVDKYV